jgi:glyoxylase-like metal-dependent hydrolase (beta-lactamase superfamily II)
MSSKSEQLNVGNVRVDAVYDMPFDVDRDRIFPTVAAEEWAGLESFLTPGGKVRLEVVSYLIRSQGMTILCDTGLRSVADETGVLLESLQSADVKPSDVDVVVFTHLHGDHIGWNIEWQGNEPVPVFPNAKYLIHRDEWALYMEPDRRDNPKTQQQLLPLERLGKLELLSGDRQLTDEVKVVETSGHTPGHMSIEIESDGASAFVQGDVVVHHVLLARPDWRPRFDFEPEGAKLLRDGELTRWADKHLLILANHFPYPGYGYVEHAGDAWSWRPA